MIDQIVEWIGGAIFVAFMFYILPVIILSL